MSPNRRRARPSVQKTKAPFLLLGPFLEKGPLGHAFHSLREALASNPKAVASAYLALWREVASVSVFAAHPPVGDAFQDALLEAFLDDPNAAHRKAERVPWKRLGEGLRDAYLRDLEAFRRLLQTDWTALARRAARDKTLPSFEGLASDEADGPVPSWEKDREKVKRSFLGTHATERLAEEVAAYLLRQGSGMFARHRVFRWRPGSSARGGWLEPVSRPDPVRLADLKGYDLAREAFLDNIRGFVSGKPANNGLIYGERGTGKSSTVKAALNEYAEEGLRLVELSPLDALDVASALSALRDRRERYLLFLDDLSFNKDDLRYRGLKALLEGSVEPLPPNVILVATSNRRHLMPETFEEREGGARVDGEVRQVDAVEEKLSLADRFGLVVSFYSPDQETYLAIVRHLAEKALLRVPKRELEEGALRWTLENNGRSGRAAAQYIRHLAQKRP